MFLLKCQIWWTLDLYAYVCKLCGNCCWNKHKHKSAFFFTIGQSIFKKVNSFLNSSSTAHNINKKLKHQKSEQKSYKKRVASHWLKRSFLHIISTLFYRIINVWNVARKICAQCYQTFFNQCIYYGYFLILSKSYNILSGIFIFMNFGEIVELVFAKCFVSLACVQEPGLTITDVELLLWWQTHILKLPHCILYILLGMTGYLDTYIMIHNTEWTGVPVIICCSKCGMHFINVRSGLVRMTRLT